MTKKKEPVTWVVMGPAPYLASCTRCGGAVERPPLPMELGAFARLLKNTVKAHEACR